MIWKCVLLSLILAVPAAGQDTIGLYLDDPAGGLMRYGSATMGVPFEIVAVMQAERQSSGVEFVMTELLIETPGVFKLATTTINPVFLPISDMSKGEYVIPFTGCLEPGEYELVRVQYGDFSGVLPTDVVMRPRGLQEGDTVPSSFDGDMGYFDCSDGKHVLSGLEWPGHPCGYDNSLGNTDGICVVNLQCVSNGAASVSALKARY